MAKSIVAKHNQRITPSEAPKVTRKAEIPTVAVTVTFRHVASTDAIRTYAERKFSHLGKFVKRACVVHLILTVDKYRQHGEVIVKSGRLSVTAEEETRDLYSVIDSLADKASCQLKSQLAKYKDKKVRAWSTGEVLTAAEEKISASGTDHA